MDNYRFSIGELAIATGRHQLAECQIVNYFKPPKRYSVHLWYLIHVPGFQSPRKDGLWIIRQDRLRKKQPPQTKTREMDQIVSWKDCGWQPQKQVENQRG